MRIVRLAGCALAVMAVGTACTTSTEPQAPAPTSAAPTTEHGSYAQCLAEHGIEGATPLGPPPGVDPAVWDEATAACADHAPGPAS